MTVLPVIQRLFYRVEFIVEFNFLNFFIVEFNYNIVLISAVK